MIGSTQVLIETILSMYDNLATRTLDAMREHNERLKIESELIKSQKKEKIFSDAFVRSVPGLLYLFNENLALIRWNTKLEEVTGYTSEELPRKNVLDFFIPDHHDSVRESIDKITPNHALEEKRLLLTKRGKTIPFFSPPGW